MGIDPAGRPSFVPEPSSVEDSACTAGPGNGRRRTGRARSQVFRFRPAGRRPRSVAGPGGPPGGIGRAGIGPGPFGRREDRRLPRVPENRPAAREFASAGSGRPVLDDEVRDPPEVPEIAGDQGPTSLQDDRRDPQIHLADVEVHVASGPHIGRGPDATWGGFASERAPGPRRPAARRPGPPRRHPVPGGADCTNRPSPPPP